MSKDARVKTVPTAEEQLAAVARQHANQLRELYIHAGVFLIGGLFFLLINLASGVSGGNVWFFWPMIPWSVALAIHAFVVLGPSDAWAERKAREFQQQINARRTPAPAPSAPSAPPAEPVATTVNDGINLVAAIRLEALQIRKPAVRQQVFELCASADRNLAVLADRRNEQQTAHDFVHRYLGAAQTIINHYVVLSSRGVSSAEPALAKVEAHDLPLLQAKFDELYDRLHRGDIIDLQVASEMLEIELAGGVKSAISQSRLSGAIS